jgi:hypothetical protein
MHSPVPTSLLRANGEQTDVAFKLIGGLTSGLQCLSLCILSAILLGILYLCEYLGPLDAPQLTFLQSSAHSH